jgi:ParB family chromosome partitioning protein
LLDLPGVVKEMLLRSDISMGHARAIATREDAEDLAREIVAKGLSVRQAEDLAKRGKRTGDSGSSGRTQPTTGDADLAALERQLGDMLGLKVKVANNGTRGTVTLHYSSLDQLDMICQRLSGESI